MGTGVCYLLVQCHGPPLTGTGLSAWLFLSPDTGKFCDIFTLSTNCTQNFLFKYINVDMRRE